MLWKWLSLCLISCLPDHVISYGSFAHYNFATSFHKWKMFSFEKWRIVGKCIPKVERNDKICLITECKSTWTWDQTRLITEERVQRGCLWNGICMKKSKRSILPYRGKCFEVKCDEFKRKAIMLHETNNACFSEHGCYKPSPDMIDLESIGMRCKCSRDSSSHVAWTNCKERS